MMSGQKFGNTNEKEETEADITVETKKTYRKDLNEGYSGYGNFDDF